MICSMCNLEVPIVVPAIVQAQGPTKDAHSHMNVCFGCFMYIHNKWAQSQQRGIKK